MKAAKILLGVVISAAGILIWVVILHHIFGTNSSSTARPTEAKETPRIVAEAVPLMPIKLPPDEDRPAPRPTYPRAKVNGTCPNDTFARVLGPEFGGLNGLPHSDCEPLPGTQTARERGLTPEQAYGDPNVANMKIKGLNCDAQASACRKACLHATDGTRGQLCRADCEVDRSRCIQGL